MKTRTYLTLILAFALSAATVFAQKEKKPGMGNYPFWSGKGDAPASQFIPALNAVLQLTDEQMRQIRDAQAATTGSKEMQALALTMKGKTGTPTEQEAARAAWEKANTELHDRVAKVLTAEQNTLIKKINEAYATVLAALREEFKGRPAAVALDKNIPEKLDAEVRAKLETAFVTRINSFLTPAQRAAFEQAGSEDKSATEKPMAKLDKPKPNPEPPNPKPDKPAPKPEKSTAPAPKPGSPETAKAPSPVEETVYDYKTVGGRTLKAYVYKPQGETVRPVIIVLHPGALMMGTAQLNVAQPGKPGQPAQGKRKFVEQGYVLVSIEYRLAPEAKLPEIIEDLQDGFQWVREKGPDLFKIDPNRVGAMGTSAGGYLTLMSGFCVNPRPKVLISVSGYGDIAGDWYAKPDPFYREKRPLVSEKEARRPGAGAELYLYSRQNGLWPKILSGHDPLAERAWFKPYCPVLNVTRDYPPTLLLHGDKDTDVPYQESEQMDKELTAKGVEHEFILNPGAGHGVGAFSANNTALAFEKMYDRLLAFADKHLK